MFSHDRKSLFSVDLTAFLFYLCLTQIYSVPKALGLITKSCPVTKGNLTPGLSWKKTNIYCALVLQCRLLLRGPRQSAVRITTGSGHLKEIIGLYSQCFCVHGGAVIICFFNTVWPERRVYRMGAEVCPKSLHVHLWKVRKQYMSLARCPLKCIHKVTVITLLQKYSHYESSGQVCRGLWYSSFGWH